MPSNLSGSAPVKIRRSPFRFLPLFLVLALLLVGAWFIYQTYFTAAQTPTAQNPVTLTHWGFREPDTTFTQAIKDFELLHPEIKINYQVQPETDYRERLKTALSSRQGPDLFRFHNTWASLFPKNLAVVPETVITTAQADALFYPVNQAWLKTAKGYVGLPLEIDGLGLYYNQSVFQSTGLPLPQTPNELRSLAKTLTITNEVNIQRAGIALGTTKNVEHWSDFLAYVLLQNGADPESPNTPAGAGALNYYTAFVLEDSVWNDTLPPAVYAFATEKSAMMVAPSWRIPEVKRLNPALQFGVAPLPQLPNREVSWATYWVEGVSSRISASRQQAAWLWLSYLLDKETLRSLYAQSSAVSFVGMPFSRVDMADQLLGDQYIGAYIAQAPTASSWYLSSYTFDNAYNDQIIAFYKEAVDQVLLGEPADEVLETVADNITDLFHPRPQKR